MVQVSVSEGLLEGEVVENEIAGSFCSFKGIPYAKPPLGDLRFKAPQPPQPWNGVRSAKEHGPIAYQNDFLFSKQMGIGSEDCLYLNVYTPSTTPLAPLPVMVWIHGGGFMCGSGNDDFYGPEFLIRHGVVLVTINYRCDALGFLCLDTEDVPGNAGMKDQVAALRWVQKNIKNFGGNPKNVTIFGESAGGASVGYHLISPMSKGLFKRAIAQSGSAASWWAQGLEHREKALTFAKRNGLTSEDDTELYNFFKNQPVSNLVGLNLPSIHHCKPFDISFSVVSEKEFGNNERFFYGDLIDGIKNGIHEGVDVMAGYTKDEGLMAFAIRYTKEEALQTANTYREFFVPRHICLENTPKAQLEIGKEMKEHYLKNNLVSENNLDEFLRFLSHDLFVHDIVTFSKLSALQNKIYVYKFTCSSERNVLVHLFGLGSLFKPGMVCHADDLPYLFPVKIANMKVEKDSESAKMIDRVTTLWTNFAKYGNPTPDSSLGVKWNPFTVEHQDYLDIGAKLQPSTRPEGDDMDFWDNLYKQYLPSWTVTHKHHPHNEHGVRVTRCRVTRN